MDDLPGGAAIEGTLDPQPLALDGPVLIALTLLDGSPVVRLGQPVVAVPDAAGRFAFPRYQPPISPYVVVCDLPGQRRLSALVLPSDREVFVDARSTAIWETLKGQVPIAGLSRGRLSALRPKAWRPDPATLRLGAGEALRAAFIGHVASDPAEGLARRAWADLLGYRPLGITRLAGGGDAQSVVSGTVPAREDLLDAPTDAVALPNGDVLIVDGSLLNLVPALDRAAGLWAWDAPMTAGRLYTVAGGSSVYGDEPTYSAQHGAAEWAAVGSPAAAPAIAAADLGTLGQVAIERLPDGACHLYVSSAVNGRVYLLPGAPLTRHGRTFEPGRLYTILGVGGQAAHEVDLAPDGSAKMILPRDGDFAHEAGTYAPTALALAPNGDLYLLDAIPWRVDLPQRHPQATAIEGSPLPGRWRNAFYGSVRVIRAVDGTVQRLPLTHDGRDLVLDDPRGLALVEEAGRTWLYVAEHDAGTLLRAALPAGKLPASLPVETVLSGLDRPGALAPAPGGGLLVADRDRLQLLRPGRPPERLAGAGGTPFLEGDARLAGFPDTCALQPDPATGDLLVTDYAALVVRRIPARP